MKMIIVLLMSVLIVGCAGIKREIHYIRDKPQPEKITDTVVLVEPPEDMLFKYPCNAVPAGESLIELALNYNKNVKCIKLYQLQIDKIRKDVKEKEKQYVE